MAKVRVPVIGTVGKSVLINTDGNGATIGKDLRMPDGTIATAASLAAYFNLRNNPTTVINQGGSGGLTVAAANNLYIRRDGALSATGPIKFDAPLVIQERISANPDIAGYGQLWVKNDIPNTLWFTDDAGTDFQLGVSTGGGDVVDDTSPQLGGDLDLNSFDIDGAGNIDITGDIDATGAISSTHSVSVLGGGDLFVYGPTATNLVGMSHDDTDFNMEFENTAEWNISGLTGPVNLISSINGLIADFGNTGDATTAHKRVRIKSDGYAGLHIAGDYSNTSGEGGGAYLTLTVDGNDFDGNGMVSLSRVNTAGEDGLGGSYTGTTGNSALLGTRASQELHFGVDHAVRMSILGGGNVEIFNHLLVTDKLDTQDPTATGQSTAAKIRHHNGSEYDVGMNVMPSVDAASPETVRAEHTGGVMYYNNSGSTTVNIDDNSDVPTGAVVTIFNIHTSGTITISASSVTLYWFQGGSRSTGNRTIAPGSVVTLYKFSSSAWFISGNGIS